MPRAQPSRRCRAELKSSQQQAACARRRRLKRDEAEIRAARAELALAKTQASSYLELLRTREWRSGFHQNLFRDMDAKVGAADAAPSALKAERDRLQARRRLEATIAAHSATIEKLQSRRGAGRLGRRACEALRRPSSSERCDASSSIARRASAAAPRCELTGATGARGQRAQQAEHATQIAQLQSEHAAKIAELQAEAETRDQEMTVLMAHLQEARRPIETIEAEVKRLTEELALKTSAINELDRGERKLRRRWSGRAAQLEEREFLIRRLERSESNNANVLGRIQTSIERLGRRPRRTANGSARLPEWSPELIRIDGDAASRHALAAARASAGRRVANCRSTPPR